MGINLNDSKSSWLESGWHRIKITKVENFKYHSGSDGHKFMGVDASGSGTDVSFNMHPNAQWKIAGFAGKAGLTEKQMDDFKPKMCVGKKMWWYVGKDGKYHKVYGWEPDAETAPVHIPDDAPASGTQEPERKRAFDEDPEVVPANSEPVPEDDIPF